MNTQETRSPPTRLIPVTHWPRFHSWPSVAGLRHMIFKAKKNGFDQVVRRVGRRVLIDEFEFFAYIDRVNGVSR